MRTGVFLGRPISVAGWALKKEAGDENSGILRFLVARRGRGSRDLTELRPGEEAELTGPLGNYWVQPEILECINEGPVALVAGGIGIAPLLALARELEENTQKKVFDFYAGFRFGSFGLESIKPRTLIIASEDGSEGFKGRIPDFFVPSGYGGVFACGPEPMLRQVGDTCIASGVPCFISVEKHMACGVGACLGCTVKTKGGNRRCCTDGPIFNAGELF
jgi:NAD(P)H-flavin reductase